MLPELQGAFGPQLTLPCGFVDLNLDSVEFSALPSGLHLVDQDVMYVVAVLLMLFTLLTPPSATSQKMDCQVFAFSAGVKQRSMDTEDSDSPPLAYF